MYKTFLKNIFSFILEENIGLHSPLTNSKLVSVVNTNVTESTFNTPYNCSSLSCLVYNPKCVHAELSVIPTLVDPYHISK